MEKFGKVILAAILLIGMSAILLSGCVAPEGKEVRRFASYEEMVSAFEEAQSGRYYGPMIKGTITSTDAPLASEAVSGSAESYSRTNIQVEGVDEADIVKTDGKYIYNFSKNRLIITEAWPIENAAIVSKTELKDINPIEMFVSGDKLLLFGTKNIYREEVIINPTFRCTTRKCIIPWNTIKTFVGLYNISDRSNPVLEKEIEFEGSYLTSRLIGNYAYFIINSWPRFYPLKPSSEDENNIIPLMIENNEEKRIAKATDIIYLPPMPAESFVTIASINLEDGELTKETLAGSAETVYASLENIYLAASLWIEKQQTVINKFSLSDGQINFGGQGIVAGHVLNQFSMDEFEGNFRIATTVGDVWGTGETQSKNNLYILDPDMNVIGKLEDLAPGERIYSVRFMGERAYMVTFKKVDPLFVIDVSDPTNPTVLGKLKIPGYSDYLHPIDESHIIGVGKETIEAAYGDFAWYQGMKLAIFDVSDVSQPKEMHKIVIGDRGTDSYALYDHKAFLYDREKELLVLPILLAEIPAEKKKPLEEEQQMPEYGEFVFQGAFVWHVTLENGFEEMGRITHVTAEDEMKRGYYFDDEYCVKRALYIDDVLYTLSERMLKANDLHTLQELKELKFD